MWRTSLNTDQLFALGNDHSIMTNTATPTTGTGWSGWSEVGVAPPSGAPIATLVGLYQWKSPVDGRHFLRVALAADPVLHHAERGLDSGIVQALWLTPTQLQAEAERHRSPLVWRAVTDYLAGSRHPLSVLSHLA